MGYLPKEMMYVGQIVGGTLSEGDDVRQSYRWWAASSKEMIYVGQIVGGLPSEGDCIGKATGWVGWGWGVLV